jgi:hypothetical protein
MASAIGYANGTWLRTSTMWDYYSAGAALCSDGKVRKLARIAATADTFFSIRAAVKVRGNTVSGYVSLRDDLDSASTAGTPLNPGATVVFIPNSYGKNAGSLPAWQRPWAR